MTQSHVQLQGTLSELSGIPAFSARDSAGNALAGQLPPLATTHESALVWLFNWLDVHQHGQLAGAGHRVVHGGEYIAGVLPQHLGTRADDRVIVAHLGNGASLCAMRKRKSVATTMGFTALDGLMMGTRCGSVDPGVLFYLMREKGMSPQQLEDLLYRRCGLLGVSGISSDMRELLSHQRRSSHRAQHRSGAAIGS